MTDRLPPIAFEQLSAAQQVAAQAVIDGPRGALYGPFVPLIRSPELMAAAQRMGEYLRYRSAIGTRLTELAILVTARPIPEPAPVTSATFPCRVDDMGLPF